MSVTQSIGVGHIAKSGTPYNLMSKGREGKGRGGKVQGKGREGTPYATGKGREFPFPSLS